MSDTIETGINWEAVRLELDRIDWEEVEPGRWERLCFIGTAFALAPSGKYYTPTPLVCSNVDPCPDCGGKGCNDCGHLGSKEAYHDELWSELMEEEALKYGLFVTNGEGDPCDILVGEYRDTDPADDDLNDGENYCG